jgi:hypothetical protein
MKFSIENSRIELAEKLLVESPYCVLEVVLGNDQPQI